MTELSFTGEVVEWRGPAPYIFLRVPEEESAEVKEAARGLEYWGQVAVVVRIGDTELTTALFPKDGVYLVPLRAAVREAERIEVGELVTARLRLAPRAPG